MLCLIIDCLVRAAALNTATIMRANRLDPDGTDMSASTHVLPAVSRALLMAGHLNAETHKISRSPFSIASRTLVVLVRCRLVVLKCNLHSQNISKFDQKYREKYKNL